MKKKTVLNYLNQVKFNVVFMFLGMIFSMIISIRVDVPASANIGALLPYVYPPFITIIAIIVYFLSRLFTKKYNWIVSIICLIINLNFTYVWYFDAI